MALLPGRLRVECTARAHVRWFGDHYSVGGEVIEPILLSLINLVNTVQYIVHVTKVCTPFLVDIVYVFRGRGKFKSNVLIV